MVKKLQFAFNDEEMEILQQACAIIDEILADADETGTPYLRGEWTKDQVGDACCILSDFSKLEIVEFTSELGA